MPGRPLARRADPVARRAGASRRRARTLAAVLAVVTATSLLGPVAWATPRHPPAPTAAQVRQAHRAAAAAADALVRAQQREADAAARLDALNARLEALVEAWDAARAQSDAAATELAAAQDRAAAATATADAAQVGVDRLAVASYQAGADLSGGLGEWAAVLDSIMRSDGVSGLAERIAVVGQLASDRRHEVDQATALRLAALQAQQSASAAASALAAQASAAASAYAAMLAAQTAQRAEVARLTAALSASRAALASARRHATVLERQRAAALARAAAERRAAAARAAAEAALRAAQPSGRFQLDTGGLRPWPLGQSVTTAAQRRAAIAFAEAQLGKPYVAGGRGLASYDCSGLTAAAYRSTGDPMIAYSQTQFAAGEKIPVTQLRPGDLVFYAFDPADWRTIHHVGMYVGNGLMVEAPHTGAFVRYTNIWMPGLVALGVRP